MLTGNATAVVYLRVSTADQALGLVAQWRLCRAYAAAQGLRIVAVRRDRGVSGGAELDDRPGLMAALGELRARGAAVLLVAKRDRLARDAYVALAVERAAAKLGAQVLCADGAGNGQDAAAVLMRRILDAAAEYERAIIRGRVKAALHVKRTRGEKLGGAVPYGWRVVDGGRLAPVEGERVAAELAAYHAQAGRSLRQVAVLLELAGHRPRGGGRWRPEQIRRMLRAA
jgi:DNA invertase Pin-like site-specific DNA recombinase